MHYNCESNHHVTIYDIDDKRLLAIDPDTVFWSLISKERDLDSTLTKEVIPIYEKFKHDLAKEMQGFRFESNLTAVYINPVDICNANCTYCYVPASLRRNGTRMNRHQLEEVLTRIFDYFLEARGNVESKPVIVFHGSEPLLIKDAIFDSIRDFNDRFHFGIQTNALLLEDRDVDLLKQYGVSVGVSLDSPQRETNDYQRKTVSGKGTFDKVVEAINWFDGYEGLSVICTITKYNVNQLPEAISFLHQKKVPIVLLNPVRGTQSPARSLQPRQEDLITYFIAAVERAIELSKTSKDKIIIGNFTDLILGIIAPTARRLMCNITPCGGARCFLTVTANGDFIPCGEFIGFEEFHAGNIFHSTIKEAMESHAFKKVRARIVEKIEECETCIFRNICGAPCPAELYSNYKDMYRPSPYCDFYKELITYAFKAIAEDNVKHLLRDKALENLEYKYKYIR